MTVRRWEAHFRLQSLLYFFSAVYRLIGALVNENDVNDIPSPRSQASLVAEGGKGERTLERGWMYPISASPLTCGRGLRVTWGLRARPLYKSTEHP